MKLLIQLVSEASVSIENKCHSKIENGLLVLLGIADDDHQEDMDWLIKKLLNLRIFDDENGVMNKSVQDIEGEILLISQFTLQASTKKGNRPSYIKAARPQTAIPLYESFISKLEAEYKPIETGIFGAEMQVSLINDGPVTIMIDSKNRT